MNRFTTAAAIGALGLGVSPALASVAGLFVVEGFETQGFLNGQQVGLAPNDISPFFSLTRTGPGAGAVIFDSASDGPNVDNTEGDILVDSGFVLIAQQNNGVPAGDPPVFEDPDDLGASGLVFTFDFTAATEGPGFVSLLSLDVIDLDDPIPDEIVITDINGETLSITLPGGFTVDGNETAPGQDAIETVDLTGATDGVSETGVAPLLEDSGAFDFTQVVTLEVTLNGSGALDNLSFEVIPTPGSAAVLALAGAVAVRRRRA